MKYFASLIIVLLSTSLMGQPYLNETSLWKQYYRYSVYPPGIAFVEDVQLQLDGDTTIGNTLYYKVLKTGIGTTYYVQGGDTTFHGPIHAYMNPIRESGQFIYAYNTEGGYEYLLYDFSAEVGDTLMSGNCNWDTIISIDTLYLGQQPRKRFHLSLVNHGEISTLVEGVGSTFGFYWQPCNVVPDPTLKLQCYSQDGDFIQFDSSFDCSGLILDVKDPGEEVLSIRPNPFTDEIEIHLADSFQENVSISIVNLMGTHVFEKRLPSPDSIERVDLQDLPAGIYVVSVFYKQGITSQKVMKL